MFVPYFRKMKKIATIILCSLIIASTLVGCMKDEAPAKEITPIPNDLGKVSRLSLFPNWFGEQIQSQTYQHSNGTVFTGNRGTILTVQANAFVTEDNQSVTGDVRIFLLELYNKKDMIMSNILPTSGGAQLVSGGEIYVEAQNSSGVKLKLAPGKTLNVKMPAGNNPSPQMQLFTAAEINQNTDWNLNTITQVNVVPLDSTSTQGGFAYDFSSTTLGWLNCDYFYNNLNPQTAVKATVSSQFNADNCLVIVSYNGLNAASRFWSYDANNNQFSPGGSYTLPIGLPVHFVAIAEINQQYYFADENATIANNHNQSLDLNPVTLDSIQVALGNLP